MGNRISIKGRVDAVEAAVHLGWVDRDGHHISLISSSVAIVSALRRQFPDLTAIETEIVMLLELGLPKCHFSVKADVRRYCGKIEAALGLRHHAETKAALDAWADPDPKGWDTYVETFRPKAEAA